MPHRLLPCKNRRCIACFPPVQDPFGDPSQASLTCVASGPVTIKDEAAISGTVLRNTCIPQRIAACKAAAAAAPPPRMGHPARACCTGAHSAPARARTTPWLLPTPRECRERGQGDLQRAQGAEPLPEQGVHARQVAAAGCMVGRLLRAGSTQRVLLPPQIRPTAQALLPVHCKLRLHATCRWTARGTANPAAPCSAPR